MCHLVILLKKTLTCLSAVADPSRYRYLENKFLLASELQVLLAAEPLLKFLRPRVACNNHRLEDSLPPRHHLSLEPGEAGSSPDIPAGRSCFIAVMRCHPFLAEPMQTPPLNHRQCQIHWRCRNRGYREGQRRWEALSCPHGGEEEQKSMGERA